MKDIKSIAVLLLLVLALGWLYWSLHPRETTELGLAARGLGQVLAEQAVIALKDRGRVVLVLMPVNEDQGKSTLQGFKENLRQHKNVTLSDVKTITPGETASGKLLFDQFAGILNQYSNVDLIVFTLGVTSLTETQIATLPKPSPQLVVMDWRPGDVERGINAGLVKAVLSTRQLTSLPTDHPRTPRQWFERYYDLSTPQ